MIIANWSSQIHYFPSNIVNNNSLSERMGHLIFRRKLAPLCDSSTCKLYITFCFVDIAIIYKGVFWVRLLLVNSKLLEHISTTCMEFLKFWVHGSHGVDLLETYQQQNKQICTNQMYASISPPFSIGFNDNCQKQ